MRLNLPHLVLAFSNHESHTKHGIFLEWWPNEHQPLETIL
jgi:hypothetical protein